MKTPIPIKSPVLAIRFTRVAKNAPISSRVTKRVSGSAVPRTWIWYTGNRNSSTVAA